MDGFKMFTEWIGIIIGVILILLHYKSLRHNRNSNKSILRSSQTPLKSILISLGLAFIIAILSILFLTPKVYEIIWHNKAILWKGIKCTLEVSLLAIIFGSIMGSFIALIITLPKKYPIFTIIDSALLSLIYILLGIPALVILFFFYYGPTRLFSPFWIGVFALSVNLAPFVAKIIIASIRNISREQLDSAVSFGYNGWQRFWYFQVLFVVKNASQSLLVEYYTTIKLSSLAGTFTLYETYLATRDIVTNTYDTVNAYIILALCYVCIVTWIALLADYLELRWKPITH